MPEIYETLEAHSVKYAIRSPPNDSLQGDIAKVAPRPAGYRIMEASEEFAVSSSLKDRL